MNALCNGHLNFVNVHPRRGGRAWTSEKRHGLRLSLMEVAKENPFGHVFNDHLLLAIGTWRRNGIPQPCQCTAVGSSIMHLQP